ncbi:serine protease 38-like isoform 2-T2 [Sarcophilus harrisii]
MQIEDVSAASETRSGPSPPAGSPPNDPPFPTVLGTRGFLPPPPSGAAHVSLISPRLWLLEKQFRVRAALPGREDHRGPGCPGWEVAVASDLFLQGLPHLRRLHPETLDLLEHFKVYVGLTDLKSINSHIQKRGIKQVIIHPLYKLTHPNGHDIALVQLSKALKFNYLVLPVCLPKSNINLDTTETCWITGWGKMRESGIMVDILQETEIPLLDQFLCQILYGSIFFIQEDMICAADLSLMKSPCQGDSGGPLVCKFNDTWIQIGVVTWGKGCSIPLYPGVFARVPYFSTWISNSIQSVIISRSTIIAVSWMTLSTALLFLHVLRTQ